MILCIATQYNTPLCHAIAIQYCHQCARVQYYVNAMPKVLCNAEFRDELKAPPPIVTTPQAFGLTTMTVYCGDW